MTLNRAFELLTVERACVHRAALCERDCANCSLVQDDKELIQMYNNMIKLILYMSRVHPELLKYIWNNKLDEIEVEVDDKF